MTGQTARRSLVGVLLLLLALPAHAQAPDDGFQLPSGRLHCVYEAVDMSSGPGASVRCDVLDPDFKAPPRGSCPLAFGDALALAERGRPTWVCHGDTVMDPQHPVLAYGRTWSRGGFRCVSATTGVRCVNSSGHGFELARRAYRVF